MADPTYGDTCVADKSRFPLKSPSSPDHGRPVHPGIVEDSRVSPDDQVAVMAVPDDQGGNASLLDCLAPLTDSRRSVNAVVALVEAGLIEFDRAAPFDVNCRVTRVGR